MKKIFTALLAALATLSATAGTKTVYADGAVAAGLNVDNWWNAALNAVAENPTDATGKVFSVATATPGVCSMGFNAPDNAFTGPLHSATLSFSWYATDPVKATIRLTGGYDANYDINVTAADVNKWNDVSFSIPEKFPQLDTNWNAGEPGIVFSVVLEKAEGDDVVNGTFYFNNVVYTNTDDNWVAPEAPVVPEPDSVPAIEQDAADVLSVFSPLGNMAFNIGGWGQSTQYATEEIDGTTVAKLTKFNYLGWEFPTHFNITDYDYMHVDFFACEETGFGFTPISPSQEKGWVAPTVNVGEWNSYDAPLSYFSNVDFADIFQIKFDQGNGKVQGYIANVYFYKDNEEPGEEPGEDPEVKPGNAYTGSVESSVKQMQDGVENEYPYTLDYTVKYNEDKTLTITATYTFTDGEPFGVVNGQYQIAGNWTDFAMADGKRVGTTTQTYEPGDKININFYIPAGAGAVLNDNVEYTVGTDNTTGVAAIEMENAPAVYYNLQGVKVANPENGIFIRVQGNKATKIVR